ncbi:peptidase S41 family protein ustP [Colletotrichum spaethianum]|uniref:Peptidase S41 family protein ustP n=1 Tax=Colletotrichum spaethianum TaxID=700344 RepID=A0AA37NYF2_9PEZI|nr:peptidase S41 family protein ustP [Colletotrichum spaethianum]GKT46177.1 peptidase S41 family protein ustP [Colletotrichum spaethianum]
MRSSLLRALALTGTTSAAAVTSTQAQAGITTTAIQAASTPRDACGIAQSAADSFLSARPSATSVQLPPTVAFDCLNLVPVDKQKDLDLLNYLEPYIMFQSTLEPLTDPPEGYLLPGVDVIGGIGQIRAKLMKDAYMSQVEFSLDLARVFAQASDGHFDYNPALLSVFTFRSLTSLVSVSDDGLSVPRVYLYNDFAKSAINDTDVWDIKSIDNVPITEWLEAQSFQVNSQDPDAKYNALFRTNAASDFQGGGNYFVLRYAGEAPDTQVIKFTNGTEYTDKLVAIVDKALVPFIGSPESIHSKVELPPTTTSSATSATSSASQSSTTATPTSTKIPGYPLPVVKHASDWISGYFLNGSNYEDTAVLVVLSFAPSDLDNANGTFEIDEARRVVDEFLEEAREAGKTKLVIDVQANGGGFVAAGFQLYNQLFPKATDVWDGNRLRAHEALNALGLTAQEVSPRVLADFNKANLNESRQPYEEWQDLFGPELIAGQNVTNLLRYSQDAFPFSPSTGDQVFDPQNIVVVTDGSCASTCAIFTGLLIQEQGVRTIALGGRPRETAMQAVGGVKGAEVLTFVTLQAVIRQTARDAIRANYLDYLRDAFDVLPDVGEPPLLPSLARSGGKFNYRNAYSRKNVDGYPQQFIYEAANCRLFYTTEMIIDPVAAWTRSADVAWKNAKCVNGSTVNSDNTIGNDLVPYNAKVIGSNLEYEGPGSLLYKGDYEPPSPYVGQQTSNKRSIIDALSPPEDFEYEFNKFKIGSLDEFLG